MTTAVARPAGDPRTPEQRRADLRACLGIIRSHARSFSFAARFLPRDLRADTAVVYAYYRHIDDLVDCPAPGTSTTAQRAHLDGWAAWLRQGAPFDPTDPVRRSLPAVVHRRGLCLEDLARVLRGQRADVEHRRPATLADLEAYAFDVAGSVGLVMATLLGAEDPDRARPAACALGTAMQLTNVCRDVAEDLDRGRIYLPRDICAARGCTDPMIWERNSTPEVRATVGAVAGRARELYAQGVAGIDLLPREVRFPIAVAARAYGGILDRLADRGHDVFQGRVATTRRTRWAMAARLAVGRATRA